VFCACEEKQNKTWGLCQLSMLENLAFASPICPLGYEFLTKERGLEVLQPEGIFL